MMTAIIVTAILLVIAIIVGAVALAFNGVFDDLFTKKDNYVEQDDGGKDKPNKDSADASQNILYPNNLNLPIKSPSGNYVSKTSGSVQQISGIASEAAILVKVNGNISIAEKNADVRVHPASMTKLMTLIVACENMTTTNTLLTVEQWMEDYRYAEGGSGIGMKVGQQISVEDTLYLISFCSDTLACLMIAKHIAGSEQAFVKLMNDKARELGLNNTHFANTTGLYDDKTNGSRGVANDYTYTTCRDMAAIMNYAMNNTAVKKIITSVNHGMPVYRNNVQETSFSPSTRWYSNPNRFNNNSNISSTTKVIAGKTGGEDIPSSCFVTVAQNSSTGEEYICVVIGRINQSGASVSEKQSTSDTRKVYLNYIN